MACEEGDFETERSGIKKLRKTLVYTAKSKKVALVVGHWKLDIVRLGILNNTMIYLSEHRITIASQCPKKLLLNQLYTIVMSLFFEWFIAT